MYITRKNIEKIAEIMDEHPDATSFELTTSGQTGIGSIMKLTMKTTIAGRLCEVTTEISGVEDW
jgi:hypothetical protein